jgi:hypothetical protein
LASTVSIGVDILVRGYRQPAKIMEITWLVTGLYLGPAAIMAYRKLGRPLSTKWQQRYGNPSRRPRLAAVWIHLFHCSAHCTLGAIIATVVIYTIGIDESGRLWPDYAGDYIAAVAVGVAFRYVHQPRRRGLRPWAAIKTFVKADLLSVSVFELALIVWLAVADRLGFYEALRPDNSVYWFIVQIGLIIGFFTAWLPAWLSRRDVKGPLPDTPPR